MDSLIMYSGVALVLVIKGVLYLIKKRRLSNSTNRSASAANEKDNPYAGLRVMALNTDAEALGLKVSPEETIVYGVVMDLGMGRGIATITSFQTGDASMYTSTGGGMLGAGRNLNVSNAAKRFVDMSQQFLDKTTPAKNTELPKSGEVIFNLLTNHGIYTVKEKVKNFDNKSSPLINLFVEGNNVITQLRLISK